MNSLYFKIKTKFHLAIIFYLFEEKKDKLNKLKNGKIMIKNIFFLFTNLNYRPKA